MIPIVWARARRRYLLLWNDSPITAVTDLAFRVIHWLILTSGLVLDNLLFPQWRAIDAKSPVFIIGHQRTGTTVVHRGLCKPDGGGGRELPWLLFTWLWIPRAASALSRIDSVLGSPLRRLTYRLARRLC